MKTFNEFVEEGKVKRITPDRIRAKSMFEQGLFRIKDVKNLPISEETASFRFEDAYESVREVLQAFMFLEGFDPYFHEATFVFGFERKILSEAEFIKWDKSRMKRHDINYRSQKTTLDETKIIIEKAYELIGKLKNKFEQLV